MNSQVIVNEAHKACVTYDEAITNFDFNDNETLK